MARFGWKVTYDGSTVLDDITSMSIVRGRTQIQDPFKAGTAVIEGRDLAGLPTIEVGKEIKIEILIESIVYGVVFAGRVSDVQITYGFTTAYDSWQIDCEDVLAAIGRAYTTETFSWAAGTTTIQAFQSVVSNAGQGQIFSSGIGGFGTSSTLSAQSVGNANALELLNTIAFTEQGFLFCDDFDIVTLAPRAALGQLNLLAELTDDPPSAVVPSVFDQVQFRSFADSFYDRVVVEPEGLTGQAIGTGIRTFTGNSYDQTTTQAGNLASYVKATLDVQTQVPSVISCLAEAQANNQLAQAALTTNSYGEVSLRLRGDDYRLFVLGLRISVTPESSRFTFNVASSEALNFFILDSATSGVLDSSRLGF